MEERVDAGIRHAVDAARAAAAGEVERLRREVTDVVAGAQRAADGLEAALAEAQQLRASLAGYLAERDRAARMERSDFLIALAEELTAGMSRRDRRRAGERLGDVLRRTAQADGEPPPGNS